MKAMILAAGFGTRLRPLTYAKPKPMVPICNRPLLGYAVENFIRAGVDEIVVNLHHLPEIIEKYLTRTYGDQIKFHFSYEAEILGTGGGVRKVRNLLESDEAFYLVNGDTIQFPPYEALRKARQQKDSLAALTLRHPPEGDRFTAVWFRDGEINGFGKGTGEPLMFSGAHLISTRVYQHLPDKDFSGIVDEVYQPLLVKGKETIAAVIDDGPWFDIGTPQRYITAAREVLDMTLEGSIPVVKGSRIVTESVVDQTASIHGLAVRSSIGARTFVKGVVRESVVGTNCRVTTGALIESCILGDNVEINRPLEIRNAVICRDDSDIPRDDNYRYENGLVILEF